MAITLYLDPNYDKTLVPIPATRLRHWWEDNNRTRDHAKHCLPLTMANSLGYYILSPGTFLVRWNGNDHAPAEIETIEASSHYEVDNHAAFGSFVVQAKFIPVTEKPGDFIFIKGIPNERGLPYTCMEACIEAWWNVGKFGIVYLLHQAGEFLIHKGKPIAQMYLFKGVGGSEEITLRDGYPNGYAEWQARRSRPEYTKDLDYLNGRTATGETIPSHIASWKKADVFK